MLEAVRCASSEFTAAAVLIILWFFFPNVVVCIKLARLACFCRFTDLALGFSQLEAREAPKDAKFKGDGEVER